MSNTHVIAEDVTINVMGAEYKVRTEVGRYPRGGACYVQLYVYEEVGSGVYHWAPLLTLSTNLIPLGQGALGPGEICVKVWSENEPFIEPILATGLFRRTGRTVSSGYVVAEIWEFCRTDHVPEVPRKLARMLAA